MITLRPRDVIVAGGVFVLCVVASGWGIARVIEARHARAEAVLECSVQMRTSDTLPEALWDANDLHAASLEWCDAFVEREGRSRLGDGT